MGNGINLCCDILKMVVKENRRFMFEEIRFNC